MVENCRKYIYCIAHRSQKEDLHVITPFTEAMSASLAPFILAGK
jgi:hypothetical protein